MFLVYGRTTVSPDVSLCLVVRDRFKGSFQVLQDIKASHDHIFLNKKIKLDLDPIKGPFLENVSKCEIAVLLLLFSGRSHGNGKVFFSEKKVLATNNEMRF